jgi:O-antigen/teichoic acid export membrane protein
LLPRKPSANGQVAIKESFRQRRPFLNPFHASRAQCRALLSGVWPICLTALLTVTYARLDQILLGSLLTDSAQLGYCSVAFRLIEACTAGSGALYVMYLPILARASEEGEEIHLQRLHDLTIWACLLICLSLSFLLKPVVATLYGAAYLPAARLALLYLIGLPALFLTHARVALRLRAAHALSAESRPLSRTRAR